MSSLTKVNVEEDADGFIDSSSFWIELSTSSVSDISVPSFTAARPFVEMPAASPVYFGSVSSLDRNLSVRRGGKPGKAGHSSLEGIYFPDPWHKSQKYPCHRCVCRTR